MTEHREPWEMTQAEWCDHIKSPALHYEHIKRAQAAGKSVPAEVLADYTSVSKRPHW